MREIHGRIKTKNGEMWRHEFCELYQKMRGEDFVKEIRSHRLRWYGYI